MGKRDMASVQCLAVMRVLDGLDDPPYQEGAEKTLWVPGEPRSWGVGNRTARRSNKSLVDWKAALAWEWRKVHRNLQIHGPVRLGLTFKLNRPKQDIDNMEKAVIDGLKDVAFEDDELVYAVRKHKEPAPTREGCGVEVMVAPYRGPAFEKHLR